MPAKILVCDPLSERGLSILKGDPNLKVDVTTGLDAATLVKRIPDYDGLVVRSQTKVTAEIINAAASLKVIGRAGIGVDNIDSEAATRRGIVVMNTPAGNAVTTAEHTIALMFAVCRRIPQAHASLHQGEWARGKFTGSELYNKTLGVVGLGNIGRVVADRALALKMKVVGSDPFLSADVAAKLGIELCPLEELYRRADIITVHTPLTEKTKNLIGPKAFSKMKRGVYIINCARGGIVDEESLAQAIKDGIVAGAALDVFVQEPPQKTHPLLNLPQVIATPHLGAATDEAQENVAIEIAEQIVDFFSNGTIKNAVNVPNVSAELLKVLAPYLTLAEKLGSLEGQLATDCPTEIRIEYRGDIANWNIAPITQSLLKGLLTPILEDTSVNYVNVPIIARERGIKVIESKIREPLDFASLVTVKTRSPAGERTVSGTIFGHRNPRIVQINEFFLEVVPEGTMLVIHNIDKPGVIGNIGSLLGKHQINISRMQLGLEKGKAEAMALFNVDGDVPPAVIAELHKLPNMISVRKVVL